MFRILLLTLLMTGAPAGYGQSKTDTAIYLPQINLTSALGFGPYIVGERQSDLIVADNLPPTTSEVRLRFLDIDGNQVGTGFEKTGANIASVSWEVALDSLDLPLSPSLNLELVYAGDSLAEYYIPYAVYPDTMVAASSLGFGPFVSNAFTLSDTLWQPVPERFTTFTARVLPPRTEKVVFYLVDETAAPDSFYVSSLPGMYMDSARWEDVEIDVLPLTTRQLKVVAFSHGGPETGLPVEKDLVMNIQQPVLTCYTGGSVVVDSIPPATQNQTAGHVLAVDSIRYMAVTNMPGGNTFNPLNGSYSFNILSNWSVESWVRFDLDKIRSGTAGRMSFMKVDSAWEMVAVNEPQQEKMKFALNCLFKPDLDIAVAEVPWTEFQDSAWHHIAFTSGMPASIEHFYFDGNPLTTNVNIENINQVLDNLHQYFMMLKTNPLLVGGCNAASGRRSDDISLITAMDEIRMWKSELSAEEISENFSKPLLQSDNLVGYWNFDALNCNGTNVADLSYQCNNGILQNGAALTRQYPGVQLLLDTLVFRSSNAFTDSVKFAFTDRNNRTIDSVMLYPANGLFTLLYDMESLPYETRLLKTTEYFPGMNGGYVTRYPMTIDPPAPIPTVRTGWGNYYTSSTEGCPYINDTAVIYNSVTLSGFPPNTTKVTMGMECNGNLSDTISLTASSNPYHHSLTLNGTDNYLVSDNTLSGPGTDFTMMFWFKTTGSTGGIITGYSAVGLPGKYGPFVKMNTDGAIEFSLPVNDTLKTLYASSKFNDGEWHHFAGTCDGSVRKTASLYIDGTLIDRKTFSGEITTHQSLFYVGYNFETTTDEYRVAHYFKGSLSEICVFNVALNYHTINQQMYLPEKHLTSGNILTLYYKLDEGHGKVVHDAINQENNATLNGGSAAWFLENQLEYTTWNGNIISDVAGEYTFFADVSYAGGPDQGVRYPLGRIHLNDPVEGYKVTWNLVEGIGLFDEGTLMDNVLKLWTDYDRSDEYNWMGNHLEVSLKDPFGNVLDHKDHIYQADSIVIADTIDMGEAITGSYLVINYGYDSLTKYKIGTTDVIPVFTRAIIPPKVTGNFGPFDQAIAPGSMVQMDTFRIVTEVYDDLDSVLAKFYNDRHELVGLKAADSINDTTWRIGYNMAGLSPPVTRMYIEYFLGNDPVPALTEGPFSIKIHRTRPLWFAFVKDSDFANVVQNPGSDTVTFEVKTPFENVKNNNQAAEIHIPESVPLIGGSESKMDAPNGNASLRYLIPDNKLSLTACDIKSEIWDVGVGNGRKAMWNVNTYNNASFYLDAKNNLFASLNKGGGGQVSFPCRKFNSMAKKVTNMLRLTSFVDPASAIISPSLSLTFTVGFEYASRQHLMIDTITKNGDWGSVGNLSVQADSIEDPHAYNNSASFQFYSGAVAGNLEISLELFEGVVEAGFCTTLRFDLGFGHSYISIPYQDTKFLKSLTVDIYGKVVVRALWGWVESTVWGPRMFYTKNLWGDNMKNCFPPALKKHLNPFAVPSGGDHPALVSQVMPATWFSKMPLAYPEASITASDNYRLFTWVERGEQDGDRRIRTKYLDRELQKFSGPMTIENNDHLINAPFTDAVSDNNVLLAWAQSRYTGRNLVKMKGQELVRSFAESQDIWYAVYDIKNDSLLQKVMISDDTKDLRSGRTEAKPVITALSDTKALITWQVADLVNHVADIWYVELNKVNGVWNHTDPKAIARDAGIETNLRIASPKENTAVLVWINTARSDSTANSIRYAVYSEDSWGAMQDVVDEPRHYYNDLNMVFENRMGALVFDTFVEDADSLHHEELSVIPWDYAGNVWAMDDYVRLMTDTICHLSHPVVSIRDDGATAIAVKIEELRPKLPNSRISQVDLFTGDLTNTWVPWNHYVANEYICDTTKEVSGLALSFIGQDTLMILTHEFVMNATNPAFQPKNGVFFGDPYMNLVLRSFRVADPNTVINIEESNYFTGVDELVMPENKLRLNQNYPNPANGETTVSFELPDNSPTTAELFDMSGHRVATLLDLNMIAGAYSFTLNTATLDPGTYICRLTACDQHAEITIIVTR